MNIPERTRQGTWLNLPSRRFAAVRATPFPRLRLLVPLVATKVWLVPESDDFPRPWSSSTSAWRACVSGAGAGTKRASVGAKVSRKLMSQALLAGDAPGSGTGGSLLTSTTLTVAGAWPRQ